MRRSGPYSAMVFPREIPASIASQSTDELFLIAMIASFCLPKAHKDSPRAFARPYPPRRYSPRRITTDIFTCCRWQPSLRLEDYFWRDPCVYSLLLTDMVNIAHELVGLLQRIINVGCEQ